MGFPSLQSRAFRSAEKLSRLREELDVVEAQLAALRWDADDAHVRALVTENVADRKEDVDAGRHVAALERSRDGLRMRVSAAEEKHRRLLQRLPPV